jgi:hypothetical protein
MRDCEPDLRVKATLNKRPSTAIQYRVASERADPTADQVRALRDTGPKGPSATAGTMVHSWKPPAM